MCNPVKMLFGMGVIGLVAALALAGCAEMPSGPTVTVWPGPGKPFSVFRQEDDACRAYANYRVNPNDANEAAFKRAAIGTTIGAVAGALLTGSSRGAGAGAGMGLIVGASSGADYSSASNWTLQRQYNIAYEQCMYSSGNQIPGAPAPHYIPPPPPPGGGG
jgi:hypothetical protein